MKAITLHEKYVIDATGKKTAAIVTYTEWLKILDLLEEYEEIKAYDKAKSQPLDPVPFNEAIKKIRHN